MDYQFNASKTYEAARPKLSTPSIPLLLYPPPEPDAIDGSPCSIRLLLLVSPKPAFRESQLGINVLGMSGRTGAGVTGGALGVGKYLFLIGSQSRPLNSPKGPIVDMISGVYILYSSGYMYRVIFRRFRFCHLRSRQSPPQLRDLSPKDILVYCIHIKKATGMTQPSQADVYAALANQSSFRKPAPPTAIYSSFADPSTELITSGPGPSRLNCTRVYCYREGCSSLILLEKAGEVVSTNIEVLPYLPSIFPQPSSTDLTHSFIYVPTPFSFENIGYSRPDPSTTLPETTPGLDQLTGGDPTGKGRVKWLICAECDLGPIGWGFEGVQGGWIDMKRVRYASSSGVKDENKKD